MDALTENFIGHYINQLACLVKSSHLAIIYINHYVTKPNVAFLLVIRYTPSQQVMEFKLAEGW